MDMSVDDVKVNVLKPNEFHYSSQDARTRLAIIRWKLELSV